MAEADETPAQKQARIRRQKREAKINASAAERLDKITRLSGRTPESMRDEQAVQTPQSATTPPETNMPAQILQTNTTDPAQLRAQEEYLKSLLRAPPPNQSDGQNQGQEQEDPMMKLLGSMFGGMDDAGNLDGSSGPSFSPDDISKVTGIPPFVTDMLMGSPKNPPTAAEVRSTRIWKVIHVVFAVLAGMYLVFCIESSTSKFGPNPPAPATVQNPFLVFLTGELLVQGTRVVSTGSSGQRRLRWWLQVFKEIAGDGAIVVFVLGCALWWTRST